MAYRAWTNEDLVKLKAMVASGASALRCSVALKRSLSMIKKKANDAGVPFPSEAELRAKLRRIFRTLSMAHVRAFRLEPAAMAKGLQDGFLTAATPRLSAQ